MIAALLGGILAGIVLRDLWPRVFRRRPARRGPRPRELLAAAERGGKARH
jgi:hypothetical protein